MKNPSGKKLEKLIFGMFDQMVEGVDKYVTEQGSTWLIFTKEKKWVVEFTKDKTLWFNYNLFKSELELTGKDCTEEKDLIKNWFESRFLNTNKVKRTSEFWRLQELNVEDTIENGVRHTTFLPNCPNGWVEDTIQNGVRHTLAGFPHHSLELEDTIQNGVRHTDYFEYTNNTLVEDTIQNGVKETTPSGYLGSIEMKGKIVHQIESPKQNNEVEDTIQNGVKDTHFNFQSGLIQVEDVIQNGVRQTNKRLQKPFRSIKDAIQNGVKETKKSHWIKSIEAEDIIENGISDVKHSYDFEEIVVKDIIEDSYPHKHRVEGVIRNTNKDGI